jgi:predicted DNA-binding transcriptional regulator AlpA
MGLSDLPKFVPLEEAANRYEVDPQALHQAVKDSAIRAVRLDEEILVDDRDVIVVAVQTQTSNQNQTEDELISINEAAKRLKIKSSTVWQWQERGWLPLLGTGKRRAKLVSWTQAQALGHLRESHGKPGSRLIPKAKDYPQRTA